VTPRNARTAMSNAVCFLHSYSVDVDAVRMYVHTYCMCLRQGTLTGRDADGHTRHQLVVFASPWLAAPGEPLCCAVLCCVVWMDGRIGYLRPYPSVK
jgi:hypothetical protein